MHIKRAVSATLLAGGIAVKGTGVASSASAGPSIGKTWNAGTTLYYAYYAATDTFCIGRGSSSPARLSVAFSKGGRKLHSLTLNAKVGKQACSQLKKNSSRLYENDRVKFTLSNSLGAKSTGYLRV